MYPMQGDGQASKPKFFEKFTPVLLGLTVVLAFIVGVLWQKVSSLEKGGTAATAPTQTGAPTQAKTIDLKTVKGVFDKNVVKFGDNNKKVLIVEMSDPSCPYCHVAGGNDAKLAAQVGSQFKYVSDGGTYTPPVPEIKKLVDAGKAAYAFIYFPGHGNGEMGTKALYCANDLGKFWEVHSLLYSNAGYTMLNDTIKNDKTKSGQLTDFLKSAADAKKIKECLDSGKYDQRLADDQALAGTLSVAGTPDFLVNDKRFDGAYNWTDMKSAVDSFLK